jgi:hypothetical protein
MSDFQIEEYFNSESKKSGFGPVCTASTKVIERVSQAILHGLRRLDALPRTNEFWQGTNSYPTINKLTRLCEKQLQEDPTNREALMTLAALGLWYCRNHFGLPQWRMLCELEEVDIQTVVHAAMHVEISSGHATINDLVRYIRESNSTRQTVSTLEAIQNSDSQVCSSWASSVLSQLGGQ